MQADFIHDVAERCAEMLTQAGYTHPATDDRGVIRAYLSVKHRRIVARPRTVHKAPYSVPSHHAAGEQQLLSKVQAGGDLWPHQSRKIGNLAVEDGMLNDFGIQHFHLGTRADPKHSDLIEGTKELLFAVVKENDFYVIGMFDHADWSRQALLDIVQRTWPHLMAPHLLKGGPHMEVVGLKRNYTDKERAKLRAAGINTISQGPGGTLRLGLGGGIATNNQSLAVTRNLIDIEKHVEAVQEAVLEGLVEAGALEVERVKLEWRANNKTFVVTEPPAPRDMDISGQINFPPL